MIQDKHPRRHVGAALFKARFKPRIGNSAVEERVFLCPNCHMEIRQSTEICPHCRSERFFGPTSSESGLAIGIGVVLGLFYSLAILDRVFWTLPCGSLGALIGFYVVQIRFDGDRWRKGQGKRTPSR